MEEFFLLSWVGKLELSRMLGPVVDQCYLTDSGATWDFG